MTSIAWPLTARIPLRGQAFSPGRPSEAAGNGGRGGSTGWARRPGAPNRPVGVWLWRSSARSPKVSTGVRRGAGRLGRRRAVASIPRDDRNPGPATPWETGTWKVDEPMRTFVRRLVQTGGHW